MTLSELETIRYEYLRRENDGTPSSYRDCKAIASLNFWNVLSTAIDLLKPSPPKSTTIADHYPPGGINEPCQQCFDASEKAEKIISQIDTAIGMITVISESSGAVLTAKELLLDASIKLGEIFEV